ncbi:MAG: hypothetical protein CMB56_006175 [Methanobacteriota archaeon]|nr:MAG: hypothetical protein CMB56_006175 [Euryarchaeota archaeon]|tara:strand:+ start:622 stop:1143 length:522 start_codon:yes stop_codon:yes gene_type:complete
MGKAIFSLGIIVLLIAVGGSIEYNVYNKTEDIPLPPMGSATGWQALPIPDLMGILEIDAKASWENEAYWLGIASVDEAERCEPDKETKVSITCSGNNINFEVGGPSSKDSIINWDVEAGEWYACVGQNSGTFGQMSSLNVDVQVDAKLKTSVTYILLGVSGLLMMLGIIIRKR